MLFRQAPVMPDRKDIRRVALTCGLLALVTLAVYWPVVRCEFIHGDDPDYVTQNPHVRGGLTWSNLRWAFAARYANNWHPLTWISHMLDCQLYGLNPAGHHATNLLFHGANTVLIFLVLRRMTCAHWRSAFVAALFALHPLHVESVAWVVRNGVIGNKRTGVMGYSSEYNALAQRFKNAVTAHSSPSPPPFRSAGRRTKPASRPFHPPRRRASAAARFA
jgi:hypothetical protein